MTTYIPGLTLPEQVFAQPASSILLPIMLGTGVGFTMQRMCTENSQALHNPSDAEEDASQENTR